MASQRNASAIELKKLPSLKHSSKGAWCMLFVDGEVVHLSPLKGKEGFQEKLRADQEYSLSRVIAVACELARPYRA